MNESGAASVWARYGPLGGIAFAVLFTAGFFVPGITPEYDEIAKWEAYWADSGNRVRAIIGMYLMVVGLFAFLWFSRTLVARLAPQVAGRSPIASLAEAASTIFVALAMVAVMVATSIAGGVEFGDAPVPAGADLPIQFEQIAFALLLVPGCLSFAVFLAGVSELGRRTGALPPWLVWAGFVAAVLLLVAVFFIPLVLVPLWSLVAGVVLLLRDRRSPAPGLAT
jgi:hypothetical protein